MAGEVRIKCSMEISKDNVKHKTFPLDFTADMTGAKGPTPGAFTAALAGTRVDLSELDTPGLCKITNLDTVNVVQWGVFDGSEFYPLGELLPGEFYIFRLSRFLGRSMGSGVAGTGTYDLGTYDMMVKSMVAACNVCVEAFEA